MVPPGITSKSSLYNKFNRFRPMKKERVFIFFHGAIETRLEHELIFAKALKVVVAIALCEEVFERTIHSYIVHQIRDF